MFRLRVIFTVSVLVAAVLASVAPARAARTAHAGRDGRPTRAPSIIDNDNRMDANNLDMVVTNHGSFGFDWIVGTAGLVYRRGSGNTALFAGGMWVGAQVLGQTRIAVAEYSQEFAPGPMRNGTFVPDQPSFRNYRIDRGDTTSLDYQEWPVLDGAAVDAFGKPLLHGDATIWSVYNDADSSFHTNYSGQTQPLVIEVQQSISAFNPYGY